MTLPPLTGPISIQSHHEVAGFDCGNVDLNAFLCRHAFTNDRANMAKTFVVLRGNGVVGFYSLCAATVDYEEAPLRYQKGVARHPMPFTLLARLGVDAPEKGRGLGSALMKDCFKRFHQASELVGSRGLLTQAKDPLARAFYLGFGFEEWPLDSLHLFLSTKDIRKSIRL